MSLFAVMLINHEINKGVVPPNREAEILYVIANPPYLTSVKNNDGSWDVIVDLILASSAPKINNPKKTDQLLPLSINKKIGRAHVIIPTKLACKIGRAHV